MTDKFDKLNAIAHEAQRINSEFHRTAREAYQFAREEYADPKYEAFRDSEEGKAWKQRKLAECNSRCAICNKIINNFNSNIDHKHPRRYYPWLAWDISNLWVICVNCNTSKGDMQWDAYLAVIKTRFGQSTVDRVLKHAPPAKVDSK